MRVGDWLRKGLFSLFPSFFCPLIVPCYDHKRLRICLKSPVLDQISDDVKQKSAGNIGDANDLRRGILERFALEELPLRPDLMASLIHYQCCDLVHLLLPPLPGIDRVFYTSGDWRFGHKLCVFDLFSQKTVVIAKSQAAVQSLTVFGEFIVAGNSNNSVEIFRFDPYNCKILSSHVANLEGSMINTVCVAEHNGGEVRIACADNSYMIQLIRLPSYEVLPPIKYTASINGVAVSPNSKFLAAVADLAHLYIIKITKTGEYIKLKTLRFNINNDHGSAQAVAWSPDSDFVAVAAESPAGCYVFNIHTDEMVFRFPHTRSIRNCKFSSSEPILCFGDSSKDLFFVDTSSWRLIGKIDGLLDIRGNRGLACSIDGLTFVSALDPFKFSVFRSGRVPSLRQLVVNCIRKNRIPTRDPSLVALLDLDADFAGREFKAEVELEVDNPNDLMGDDSDVQDFSDEDIESSDELSE